MKRKTHRSPGTTKKEITAHSASVISEMKVAYGSAASAPAEVRTNIVMEEPLVMEAQAVTGIKTKTGVVHYALREVVRRARQKEMLALRGKVHWEGDLNEMRKSHY